MRKSLYSLIVLVGVLVLTTCESVDLSQIIRRPEVRVAGTRIERLTFSDARVRFDLEVTNPNPVGVQFAGYDYDLQIEGASFVKGDVAERFGLDPGGSSLIPVPVEVTYQELLNTYTRLREQDEFAYNLGVGLWFELPVLDRVRVGANKEGTLPVIRAPRFELQRLELTGLSLNGATVLLALEMRNPNSFGFTMNSLDYRFAVSDRQWASGVTRRPFQVREKDTAILELPVQVDFGELGRSARDLLVRRRPLDYTFEADLAVATGLELLGEAVIPIRLGGQKEVDR